MKKKRFDLATLPERSAKGIDERFHASTPLRRMFNKVFPDHWSFMLGEIALYSFIVLLLTGTFLGLFFDPSMEEVKYDGVYTPLKGIEMSKAYESTLDISFEVRGGLIMRQMHHWAALLFMASIVVHMLRVFFTGAFRKPREANWMIGFLLFWLGFMEGLFGYSIPDDGLSGTGLRVINAITQSIPVIGSWAGFALFGGEFPGTVIIPRFYILHVLIFPAIILGLIAAHMGLLVKQKHTQWPGPGRTNKNVVGVRMFPGFAMKGGGFFMITFAVIAAMGGLFQINPIWLFGPYQASVISSASQPDWYVMFLDGIARLWPAWETRFELFGNGYTIPPIFWAAVVLPGVIVNIGLLYPFLEARFTKDKEQHHLLQRPRDTPVRTGLGMMALAFYLVLFASGGNDVIAQHFDISLNAMTWIGRIALLLAPPAAFWISYRIALGLQQHDREVLAHGVETGIIKRAPDGRFYEVHQPLGPVDDHGHGQLEYEGWVVPKKMNRIGALGPAIRGFFSPLEVEDKEARKGKAKELAGKK
ncbi:cytochrome b [Longispora albida]|uniref:cytochrome bc1 complex cytochrome b subunit n=1 Tax=Longispora albida TaxID=203523 RepID=UPI000380BE82|nr:ubiquinol-cytochrome c reductase cytochrome b subunit [Longispora albida]